MFNCLDCPGCGDIQWGLIEKCKCTLNQREGYSNTTCALGLLLYSMKEQIDRLERQVYDLEQELKRVENTID